MKRLLVTVFVLMTLIFCSSCSLNTLFPDDTKEDPTLTDTIETEKFVLTIIEESLFAVGTLQEGEYYENDVPIAIFLFELTNKTTEPEYIFGAFIDTVEITQETDKTIEKLHSSNRDYKDSYFGEYLDNVSYDLKPGATIQAAIAYEVKYPDQPIYVGFLDERFGDIVGGYTTNLHA